MKWKGRVRRSVTLRGENDERHIVVRGQGCNHFLETDFSGFPVGPPHCGLFGTADCFLHAVCWDLCDPMPVTSCTLAFTLVHGGVYRESVLVVLWIQVEGMMERLVRIYSLGGMFGYEKEKWFIAVFFFIFGIYTVKVFVYYLWRISFNFNRNL